MSEAWLHSANSAKTGKCKSYRVTLIVSTAHTFTVYAADTELAEERALAAYKRGEDCSIDKPQIEHSETCVEELES